MMMWKLLRTMLDLIRFTMLVKANTRLVRLHFQWVCVCACVRAEEWDMGKGMFAVAYNRGQWMNHDNVRKNIKVSIIHSRFFFVRHIIARIWSNIWRRI